MNIVQQLQELSQMVEVLLKETKRLNDENRILRETSNNSHRVLQQQQIAMQQRLDEVNSALQSQTEASEQLKEQLQLLNLAHQKANAQCSHLTKEISDAKESYQQLLMEKEQLLKKNEYAKTRVEAIMNKLMSLNIQEPVTEETDNIDARDMP